MKILSLMLLFLLTLVTASELVTKSHLLKPGDEITFYPKRGESFAVSKDYRHFEEDASYDIAMKNGNRIYFENRNQEDDTYIIFNEATDPGDVVLLKINKGYFTYTTQSYEALPKTVKKVLKASAKRKKAKKRTRKKDLIIETEEFCFDSQGEIVDCKSPLATINQPQEQEPIQPATVSIAKIESTEIDSDETERKESGFISTFADKIKAALRKITENLKASKTVKQEEVLSEKSPEKIVEQKNGDFAKRSHPSTEKKSSFPKDNLNRFNHLSDAEIRATSVVKAPHFQALPRTIERSGFDQVALSAESVSLPAINKTALFPEPAFTGTDTAPSVELSQAGYRRDAQTVIGRSENIESALPNYQKPLYRQHSPLSSQQELVVGKIAAPQMKISAPGIPGSELPVQGGSKAPALERHSAVQEPVLQKRQLATAIEKPELLSKSERSSAGGLGIEHTISGPGVAPQPSFSHEERTIEAVKPTVAKIEKPDISERAQTVTPPPPVVQSAPAAEVVPSGNKIVITKIIDKNKTVPRAGEMPIPMRDRILGGGYSAQNPMGEVRVRAYSNRKPVSAWVEVYKGKRRVKTFYTGGGKSVKLPAGTYVMKATYRTGTSKQKKSLGKVHLQEGETINKRVYFNVGKLNVVAQRQGKPLYVKVEIYKKGSKRRYAYTFSSRRTGQAHLQLAEGRYKIVVIEHGNRKVFDNVSIKGNSTKTLRAEF